MIQKKFIDSELYKKIVAVMPIPTVDVLIFNESLSKTVLFKRNNPPIKGVYYSLGGRLNLGESFNDCAKRKLEEEVGLEIPSESLFQKGVISEKYVESGKIFHFSNVYYMLILGEDTKLNLDSQHENFKWFNLNDSNIHPYIKEKIKNCIKQ